MPCREGEYEWTATVYNVNEGNNKDLMNKCKILREYDLETAIEKAIEYCVSHDVLKDFLLEHKSEVADMLRMEYDETKTMDHIKEDYFEEGQAVGAIKTKVALICKKLNKGMSQENIAELLEEDISYVKEICEEYRRMWES